MGTEEKYMKMVACWTRACDCEQAKNPMGKAILFTLAALGLGGLLSDSLKHAWEKYSDKKPSKHVTHKGKKVDEVKYAPRHVCDVCGKLGTSYQAEGLPYDLCKNCYKAAKKKSKEKLEAWYKKHPEEKKKDDEKSKEKKEKKSKKDADGSDDEGSSKDDTTSEAGSTSKADSSKPDDEDEESEAKSESETKSEAKSEKKAKKKSKEKLEAWYKKHPEEKKK